MSTFSGKTYDAANYEKKRPTYPASLYEYLREYTGVLEGEKLPVVVDLACGPGEATLDLAKTIGEKVFGVDPSAGMIAQAEQKVKPLGSQVDLIVGNDESLTSHFAKHSVDLLCAAEAAHWFTYPDFWHTAHSLLKPGGTLAIWAYYFFHFEGYPESARIVKEFSLSDDKCGPYWGAGQYQLNTLYDGLTVPSTLFENEKRILNLESHPTKNGPFELKRVDVTVAEALSLLSTYSGYHNWKEANPGKRDILEATIEELTEKTGLTLDSKVTVNFETVLICAKAKVLE